MQAEEEVAPATDADEVIATDQPPSDPFVGKDLDELQDEFEDEEPRQSER